MTHLRINLKTISVNLGHVQRSQSERIMLCYLVFTEMLVVYHIILYLGLFRQFSRFGCVQRNNLTSRQF